LTNDISVVDEREYALLDLLLTESGRPVTWWRCSIAMTNQTFAKHLRTTAALLQEAPCPK
jgi:hypothetical protein